MKGTMQGKTRLFQLGAVITILISVSIYVWSLKSTSVSDPYIAWASNRYGSKYMLRFCYFLLSGFLCVFVWKISKNKIYVGTLFISECILYCLLRTWLGYDLGYRVKGLCFSSMACIYIFVSCKTAGIEKKEQTVALHSGSGSLLYNFYSGDLVDSI